MIPEGQVRPSEDGYMVVLTEKEVLELRKGAEQRRRFHGINTEEHSTCETALEKLEAAVAKGPVTVSWGAGNGGGGNGQPETANGSDNQRD